MKKNYLNEEYKVLSNYFEKTSSIQFTLFPIFLTGIIGFVSFRFSDTDAVGLLFQLFLFILLIFLGFCHSMLHNYGLKLVELELKMNKTMKLKKDKQFSYFTRMIGSGQELIPFFKIYTISIITVILILYIFAEYYFWVYLESLNINCLFITSFTILKLIFALFILNPLLRGDTKIIKAKQELINSYK